MTRYLERVKNNRLGLLGGGQLARMLALAAAPLGLDISVLTTSGRDPAGQVCGQVVEGPLESQAALARFLDEVDLVTFESEFVDVDKLKRALPKSVKVFPSLKVIGTLQDRLTQKKWLDRFSIPTSPWRAVSTPAELASACEHFAESGLVLKQRRFGYDGYGTTIWKDPRREGTTKILTSAPHGFIAEQRIDFSRELAVSFVRSSTGEFVALPLVESVQIHARCFSVHGPTHHRHLARLTRKFKRFMNDIHYVGVLAVELFETRTGDLLVNELAPRVHNSAHHSLDSMTCSQFEYHVRAGLGWKLPQVQLIQPGFAMVNLLGEGGRRVHLSRNSVGHLHWYGKDDNRAGRKLGHVNVLAGSGPKALTQALKWRKEFRL